MKIIRFVVQPRFNFIDINAFGLAGMLWANGRVFLALVVVAAFSFISGVAQAAFEEKGK